MTRHDRIFSAACLIVSALCFAAAFIGLGQMPG